MGFFEEVDDRGKPIISCRWVGISIKQNPRGISLSTNTYCISLKEIHNIGIDKNRTLNDQEIKQLLRLSGQLNWIVF